MENEIAEGESPDEEEETEEPLPPDRQRIELEIKTSTLPELAAWCRTLGLSEGGTKAELAKRIREHFSLPEPRERSDENRKVITIESAQTTEYFKIEIVDEEYARLKGDVNIILKDKDSVHTISADEILFNRTRNILTARGKVSYKKVKDDTTETFYGENITVNIDDWSSVFLDGNSVKKFESEASAYRFTGSVITRNNNEDVMILKDAQVSNADSEEAYWSISASKLILLPSSDFYIFNAVLKVGEIPVLYLPAFFFPADEVIFHPTIGYRSREGGFVQTTTYILGRPKANQDEGSSLSRILGNSNDMEKERQGLFLRSTGKKVKDMNETTLKALIDYYTNLGIYAGLDFYRPSKKGLLSAFDLSMGVGFTRTISFDDRIGYTPYGPDYDGSFDWNSSNLFSYSVPFRYRLKTESSINGKYGSLSWSFPYYSDPYVEMDFLNRAETMDWLKMIEQGGEMDENTIEKTKLGAYSWNIKGNFNPSIKFLSPYVSNISFNPISTTLLFIEKDDKNIIENLNERRPEKYFYAPDKYTIYSISSSISGNPLSINTSGQSATGAEKPEVDDPLKDIGIPRSPWTKEEDTAEKDKIDEILTPPVLNQSFDLPKFGDTRFNITYSLSPSSTTDLQFRSLKNWETYEDVDWSEVQSILTSFRFSGEVNFKVDHSNNLYSNVVTFSGDSNWRGYGYLNEEAEAYLDPSGNPDPVQIARAKEQQYSQTNYSTSYAYNGTLRPLYQDPIFGQSNLQYGFKGTLVRSKRFIEGGDKPELSPQWGSWVKQKTSQGEDILGLTSHQLSTNLAANIMDKQQSISLSANLPPLDGLISTNAVFRAWISETTASIKFEKPEFVNVNNVSEPNDKWIKGTLNLAEALTFGSIGSFRFSMAINPEENNEITTVDSTLTFAKSGLWNFTTRFVAGKDYRYEFAEDPNDPSIRKWQQYGEQVLTPKDLTLRYVHTLSNYEVIKNRLRFSTNFSTDLSFKLQQYTNSSFIFSLGFTLDIAGFLDLSMDMGAKNNVIWRYFKNISGMDKYTYMYPDGPQNNLFTDLFDSFNFADEDKRRRSGFKMNGFHFKATHFLGDWNAELDVTIYSELNRTANPPKHEVNTDVSFFVKWVVIPELKKEIEYKQNTDKWTVK